MEHINTSWHKYFIDLLDPVSKKSKDPSTQVGAIIVDNKNRTLSTGFNGFPRGVNDDSEQFPERYERPAKYKFTEHAERNAIYTAASHGIPLEGCTIYIEWYPCTDCARAIIQSGIINVVIDGRQYEAKKKHWDDRWKADMEVSVLMLTESSVGVYIWDGERIKSVNKYV